MRFAVRVVVLVAVVLGARVASAAPAPIHVGYDLGHLDLDRHELQFKPSRAVTSATITAIGEDGALLGTGAARYDDAVAGRWLAISWTQEVDARVLLLRLRVAAADGAATNVELVPWSVEIAHEDVNFRTDSAVIDPSETEKLDASRAQIEAMVARTRGFVELKLYVAGHTDTVGPAAKNRTLSRARAVAIARYFRDKGVTLPIAVAGFGEDVPKAKTADETDARVNRRADYVLGPTAGTPPFRGPYLKARAGWTALPTR